MNLLSQIAKNKNLSKPVIYGISGLELNDEEKNFFKKNGCVGFILFARNIRDKIQLKKLTDSLRELMEGEVLILIDQEGGRVARLRDPHWRCYPNGEYFAKIYQNDHKRARELIYQNFSSIACDLKEVGINVNCAPILDLKCSETHEIISDRAYGALPAQVAELSLEVCKGLLENEIYPVIKHIPGHGRATCDSHLELPRIDASYEQLKAFDFKPFELLKDQKFAMTAHILYSAIDDKKCATISPKMIDLIRNDIGFKNILMSDDLSMKALGGSFKTRAKATIDAGCDLILHCNGDMKEMVEINSALNKIDDNLRAKFVD